MHTPGKHYVARAENIARYTGGRFHPTGQLDESPDPLHGPDLPPPAMPRLETHLDPDARNGLLLTEDDLTPDLPHMTFAATATISGVADRSPFKVAPQVDAFTKGALCDARTRLATDATHLTDPDALTAWARENGISQIVLPYVPVGPAWDLLAHCDLPLRCVARAYDKAVWPHATAGFFKLKKRLPQILASLQ